METLLRPFAGAQSEEAAERLIAHFGSLGRALAASPEQLERTLGRPIAEALVGARDLVRAGLLEQVKRTPVSVADPNFRDYLRSVIGRAASEGLHVTFVGPDWGYLADELIATGGVLHVEANLRQLLTRAFDVAAHGVILAHNHSSGSAAPSREDIDLTRRMAGILRSVGLELLDHLVVGGGNFVSMREKGLL